jgi:hypothetical protein
MKALHGFAKHLAFLVPITLGLLLGSPSLVAAARLRGEKMQEQRIPRPTSQDIRTPLQPLHPTGATDR